MYLYLGSIIDARGGRKLRTDAHKRGKYTVYDNNNKKLLRNAEVHSYAQRFLHKETCNGEYTQHCKRSRN